MLVVASAFRLHVSAQRYRLFNAFVLHHGRDNCDVNTICAFLAGSFSTTVDDTSDTDPLWAKQPEALRQAPNVQLNALPQDVSLRKSIYFPVRYHR